MKWPFRKAHTPKSPPATPASFVITDRPWRTAEKRLLVRAGFMGRKPGGTPDLWFIDGLDTWREFPTWRDAYNAAVKKSARPSVHREVGYTYAIDGSVALQVTRWVASGDFPRATFATWQEAYDYLDTQVRR